MDDHFQGVLYSRGARVDQVAAQRVWIPWQNPQSWFADPPANLTVTHSGAIHVMADQRSVLRTRDGGRTWDQFAVVRPALGVLRDGTFLNATSEAGGVTIYRSDDEGKTYRAHGHLPVEGGVESITELTSGNLICPIAEPQFVRAYRSDDGGKTWSQGHPICPGGKPQIIELQSGRLLAVVRHNPRVGASNWQLCFKNELPWRLWMQALQRSDIGSYVKRILLADSDDGGRTWHNVRPATFLLEEMHGEDIQLPDDRLVLFYTHRVPPLRAGERAKVSRDEGKTWEEEIYYMNATRAVPGYSASCVLPPHLADGEEGMILTIVGERSERKGPRGCAANAGRH